VKPILVPANVDGDSTVLSYEPTEYRYAFTQPIVIAVLAAAPGVKGLQVDEDCRTAFGTATSSTVSTENSTFVKAGVSVGIKAEAPGVGAELKASVSAEATKTYGKEYKVEQLIVRETGPLEDAVIFTTVPYDFYTYRIVSDPDLAKVGMEVTVGYPRSPITTMFELKAYNGMVPEKYRIGPEGMRVFQHMPGDVCSYRTREGLLALSTVGPILKSQEIDVGQGGGNVQAEISVEQAASEGQTLRVEAEFEAEFTGGFVMAGFSVGGGTEKSLTVTTGTQTIFQSTVGNIIRSADFQAHHFSYGLAAYVRSFQVGPDSTMSFQVLDYWVRKPDVCPE
jgi:hypothetical protein